MSNCSKIGVTVIEQTIGIQITINYNCKKILIGIGSSITGNNVVKKDEFTIDDDYEYDLSDIYMIDKIIWNSDADLFGVRIGTSPGSNNIYFDNDTHADQWYSVTKDIFGSNIIYFTNFSGANTRVVIYKRKL